MRKRYLAGILTGLFIFAIADLSEATPILTNPTPTTIVSDNAITLRMDLNGYPNYGVADTASDVLYTGDSGNWIFNFSDLGVDINNYDIASVTASLILDDHYARPSSNYFMKIDISGVTAFNGQTDTLGIVHGSPYGAEFVNWTSHTFDASLIDPLIITIQNNSTNTYMGDWIAIDYLEVKLSSTQPVPEPSTILLTGIGLALACFRKKGKNFGRS